MAYEFTKSYTYKYPRVRAVELLDGTTVGQKIGYVEKKIWTCEWVKYDRIATVITAAFPQTSDGDYIIEGKPGIERALGEGHDLWNISITASRFLEGDAIVSSPLMSSGIRG